jgi:hypothetical protein
MPEGIKLFKINVSTIGECNFMTDDSVKEYTKIVKSYQPYLLRKSRTRLSDSQIKQKLTKVTRVIKTKETKEELNELKKEMKKLFNKIQKTDKPLDEDVERLRDLSTYISNYDKSYTINIFNPGNTVMNKIYSRSNIESTKTDWVINALNMKGKPDLLKVLSTQTRRGESKITLQDLIQFLKSRGVKEIFLFDFSCSVLRDSYLGVDLSPRSIRRTRRSTIGGTTYKLKSISKKFKKKYSRTRKNKSKVLSGGLYGP